MMPKAKSISTLDSLDAFFGGIGFVMSTPRIWPYAAVPALIMLVLTCGGAIAGIWGVTELLDSWLGTNLGTLGTIGYWALMIPMAVIALLIAVLLGLLLAQPLSGLALEKIVHAQERRLTGFARPGTSFLGSLWLNLRTVVFAAVLGGPALVWCCSLLSWHFRRLPW